MLSILKHAKELYDIAIKFGRSKIYTWWDCFITAILAYRLQKEEERKC